MQQLVNRCQVVAVLVMRALPRLRGHGRLAGTINRYLRRAGAAPLVTTRMRQGHRLRLDVRVPSQAQALYSGDYDSAKLAILCRTMPPGAVSLDVGANIGFYAVPLGLAARAAGGRVIAFEPMAANYRRLVENLALNDLQGTVDPHPIGLAAMP